jgi:hypothetical protein
MEIIIFVAVVVVAALLWSGYVKTKKTESDQTIDNWQPPRASPEKEWPFGEKLSEGKIHVKVADVASVTQLKTAWIEATTPVAADSQDRVETPAPTVVDVTAENKAAAVTKAKKAPAKKTAAKPAAAKRAPAKKKST